MNTIPLSAALERTTLFFDGASSAAVLVTNRNGKRSQKKMRFTDPHAALTHCIQRGTAFVFLPAVKGN